jgi:pyridoxamine 5'-phosphate oxidase
MENELAALRAEYTAAGLAEGDLEADPFRMFRRWMAEVASLAEPNAMVLATVSDDGQPSARLVLLKGLRPDGFVFFTNHASRKGHDLAANPRCALVFPWHGLQRQVRVEGSALPLPRAEVESYFRTRPRGAQLGAWASPQSTVVTREELDARYADVEARYADDEVPVPDGWGGYVVVPESVEFWQGRAHRLHDRLVYRRTSGESWAVERLAP